jgi:endo-1,4-beta-xylanase
MMLCEATVHLEPIMFWKRALSLLIPAVALTLPARPADVPQHPVILLWPSGAPGSEGKTGDEKVRIEHGEEVVTNVHRPSLTVYLPPKSNGAAVIVAPGGGFREMWTTHEGYRVAEWLNLQGVAAFVLKYRLQNEAGSTYKTEEHSLADMQRAIRTVRARASEWAVDPNRIGIIGFSAGARLSWLAATRFNDPVQHPVDAIDKQSARPTFQALIYPGKMPEVKYAKDTPEAFLLCGSEDQVAADVPALYQSLKAAGVPTELHIYVGVGHGFGIRESNPPALAGWVERFGDWMRGRGWLKSAPGAQ